LYMEYYGAFIDWLQFCFAFPKMMQLNEKKQLKHFSRLYLLLSRKIRPLRYVS
jgi:hypothetical protein